MPQNQGSKELGLQSPKRYRFKADRKYLTQTLLTRSIIGITAAICFALLIAILSESWVGYIMHQNVQTAIAANSQLKQNNVQLQQQIQNLESPSVIEAEARDKLFYSKPGDILVEVIPVQPAQPQSSQASKSTAKPSGHWEEWIQALLGR